VLTGYQLSAKSANYYSVCLMLQGKWCQPFKIGLTCVWKHWKLLKE
jgi:hypothetical protein